MLIAAALHPAPAVHVATSSLTLWVWLFVVVAAGVLGAIALALRR